MGRLFLVLSSFQHSILPLFRLCHYSIIPTFHYSLLKALLMDTTEITKYLDMARRRKYWIIIPFLAAILAGLAYVLTAPKAYEAQTLILVQAQSVPQDLVRSIVTESVEDRLRTITQQVTSRTNLEKIIQDYRLDGEIGKAASLDVMVEGVRKRITIDVGRGGGRAGTNSFSISYRGKDPRQVMQVTNALASNFISQNLEIRESQVLGTSAFLAEELESVRRRLAEKEEELKGYRERYMGGLPDQLAANLAVLQRLQLQMDQLSSNLRDAENRKFLTQQTLEEARSGRQTLLPPTAQGREVRDLATLRNELAALEARYTPNHPDVVRLKKTIETLEAAERQTGTDPAAPATVVSRAEQALVQQLRDIDMDIAGIRAEMKKVQAEISVYQRRVEDTPKREQELFSIQRDYNNQRDLYNSLLQRKLESDIAVSMERKQKGEQFRIIDPAKVPTVPVEPDVKRILLMVVALSFGLGGGLAYVREMMDTSFKAPDEAEKELDMKVLVSIPYRYTEKEIRKRKIKEAVYATSVVAGFAVGAVAIILGTKGVDGTLNFFKGLMGIS
jgi:polysaccharide chain length determinant protein (PEP-CTERM system associated)